MELEARIKAYAKVAIRKGLNVQKNQEVIINAGLDQPEFVKMLVEEAYLAGAKHVQVNWTYDPITRLSYEYESVENLSIVRSFELDKYKWMSENLPAVLRVLSDDPNVFKGIDQTKVNQARRNKYPLTAPYSDAMEDKYQWCIIAVPSVAWAKHVYPKLSEKAAVNKLWNAVLDCSRIGEDSIKMWNEHNQNLKNKCDLLTSYRFDYLHYHSSNGTNFKVWLHPDGHFVGGSERTTGSKVEFNPNIPSEEVFTTPIAGKAEGIVYATKPLVYNGEIIDKFSLTFKDGSVVKVKAEVGEKLLKTIVATDPGAARLGEVALVPISSPINQSNTLFYETLFDENAACHLALGAGFNIAIDNHEDYTILFLRAKGVNESMIHVDFMIGDETLNIDGYTKDGQKVAIFINGMWAL